MRRPNSRRSCCVRKLTKLLGLAVSASCRKTVDSGHASTFVEVQPMAMPPTIIGYLFNFFRSPIRKLGVMRYDSRTCLELLLQDRPQFPVRDRQQVYRE